MPYYLSVSNEKKHFLGYPPLSTNLLALARWDTFRQIPHMVKVIHNYCPESEITIRDLQSWIHDMNEKGINDILINPKMVGYREDQENRTYYRLHYIDKDSGHKVFRNMLEAK